jgi:hypothetical protein
MRSAVSFAYLMRERKKHACQKSYPLAVLQSRSRKEPYHFVGAGARTAAKCGFGSGSDGSGFKPDGIHGLI